jgi:mRNA-degrading endonuclease toxin of MazEF toxin-antitoxin module
MQTLPAHPRRGEVYLVRLGTRRRPAVILSIDALNRHALDVCVVGLTTVEHARFSMRVPVKAGEAGLNSDCWAKCDQVTTLEKTLLQHPSIGRLSGATLKKIQDQVKISLGLD